MQAIRRDTIIDGRYRVLRRLGSGGMAEVWCAEDEQLGRGVALKLLARRFAEDAEFRERFRREAQAAAGLQHPNIVGIFDRGNWDGTAYIAMELVDGRTLKELIRDSFPTHPLPPGRAVDLVIQILRALRYAHKRGIVHRDIKPQNVILDEEGQAKVADFGIARAAGSDMTETGAVVGTVQYISPEQAQGQPVSSRSDLYSAGIVLYELLTGRVPFDGEALVSVALKQVSEPPTPPSQLQPGIPPALEAVVMRALEKDPARRFQTADEFIAALEASRRAPARQVVLEPTPGEPWSAVEEEREPSRWWAWLLVLLLLAAMGAGAYFLLASNRVDVPSVVGKTSSAAAERLHRDGLELAIRNAVSDKVERDHVIAQDPDAGARVREGSVVTLTISVGRGTAPVPHVEGLPRAEAERAVRDAGFNPKVRQEFSDSVPAGQVIRSSPAEGTEREKGSTVTLTVSRGRETVAVPKLTGLDRDAAEQAVRDAGLQPNVTEKESAKKPGTVLEQDPGPGATVDKGATVNITVAKPRPKVPDVTTGNPPADQARKTLEDAGYKVKVVERPSPGLEGRVIGQNPAAGEPRSTGATVTIAVGQGGPAPPTPTPSPAP